MLNPSKYIHTYITTYVEYLREKKYKEARLIPRGLSPLAFHGSAKTPWGLFFWFNLFLFGLFGASIYIALLFDIKLYPAILLLTPSGF